MRNAKTEMSFAGFFVEEGRPTSYMGLENSVYFDESLLFVQDSI
jgi:hypothetical protein